MLKMAKIPHATERQQQRGLKQEVFDFILDYGRVDYGSGGIWYHVREDELPSYLRGSEMAALARPWVVLVQVERGVEKVWTVYPVNNVSRHINRKCRAVRYRLPRRRRAQAARVQTC